MVHPLHLRTIGVIIALVVMSLVIWIVLQESRASLSGVAVMPPAGGCHPDIPACDTYCRLPGETCGQAAQEALCCQNGSKEIAAACCTGLSCAESGTCVAPADTTIVFSGTDSPLAAALVAGPTSSDRPFLDAAAPAAFPTPELSAQSPVSSCGNGRKDQGEECDEGTSNANTPNALCRYNCTLSRCGDGIVDGLLELCDDGNTTNNDGCSAQCMTERESVAPAPEQHAAADNPLLPEWIEQDVRPSTVAPTTPVPPRAADTGPAALTVMAAALSAGVAYMRRRRT